jgi:hypothetical protein
VIWPMRARHGLSSWAILSIGGASDQHVAAASTIPVTSAVAQAKTRKSFRILVIDAPLHTRHVIRRP